MSKLLDMLDTTAKEDNLQVNVKRYYTDVNGLIVDKSTVPSNLQVKYPFYLFHKFDKVGGFRIGQQVKKATGGSFYYYTYDVDMSFDYWQISGSNNIKNQLRSGDTCILFTDDVTAPNYLVWIVISCPLQSYSSIVNSLPNNIEVKDFLYIADNTINYNEALHFNRVTPVGIYEDNQYQPLAFKTRETVSQDFIAVKLSFKLTQYLGIFSYMSYNTDSIQFIFNLKY
jgi:hypothetical protein